MITLTIVQIDQNSIYLEKVKSLWRKNSATLGFFPGGAFYEYAMKKQILVGITKEELFGYLMYRISRMKVGIIHLCIDSKYRGQKLTKLLVSHLIQLTTHEYQGIFLSCRRDFPANNIWSKLGFVPIGEKTGKNIEGKLLCYWWYDFNHPTLFSELDDEKKITVMDANVFYDIIQESDDNSEVKVLLTDYIQDEIKLCLTAEIYNEINRNGDPEKRDFVRGQIYKFEVLTGEHFDVERIQNELSTIMSLPKTKSDISDRVQLAHAISKGADFFVTRDEEILNQTEAVFNKFGLRILRPITLILYIDEILRESEYQPIRLAGTKLSLRRITSEMVENLINEFFEPLYEKKSTFRQKMMSVAAISTDTSETFIIENETNTFLGLFSIKKRDDFVAEIPILRVIKNRFSSTLARHLIHHIINKSIKYGMKCIKITDFALSKDVLDGLSIHGFVKENTYWIKICLRGIYRQRELVESLKTLNSKTDINLLVDFFTDERMTQRNIDFFTEIENIIWPLKIFEAEVPTYIVPIKHYWAMELFDEELACRSLFGVEASLALNVENAYYTSKCLRGFTPPARILWYVSENKNSPGTKSLRACSLVREVTIAKPKELYNKYQRYGVYKWEDVFKLSKKDENRDIMAFQFANTEQFSTPIKWDCIQNILLEDGIRSTFQSITKIPYSCFLKLYEIGIKGDKLYG
jgi:predicted nucleic acid-binding protein/GNAT superfamily N-acetyltransferase